MYGAYGIYDSKIAVRSGPLKPLRPQTQVFDSFRQNPIGPILVEASVKHAALCLGKPRSMTRHAVNMPRRAK